jgi:hypothetical protein
MSRKSFALAIVITIGLVGLVSGGGYLLVKHEPGFYKHNDLQPGPERKTLSDWADSEIVNRLWNGIVGGRSWEVNLREDHLNASLAEGLLRKEAPWPDGLSAPRLSLEEDRILFGFRYGRGQLSAVIWLEVRPWLAVQDPNVLALELVSLHAGAIPISSHWLLEKAAEAARSQKIDVNYYRYNKHPVLVLRFQADRSNPTFHLHQLKVIGPLNGSLGFVRIAGQPPDQAGERPSGQSEG